MGAACGDSAPPMPTTAGVVDTVVTVSFRGLPTPSPAAPVAVSSDLSTIAVAHRDQGEIFLFDGTGQLVHQTVRPGQGPGEFRDIAALAFHPRSDSLWVLDRGNVRVSVLTPNELSLAREIRLPGWTLEMAWASESLLLVQGQFEVVGEGTALGMGVNDGDPQPVLREEGPPAGFPDFIRPVTSAANGGVWVGHFRDPRLLRLDAALEVHASLEYPTDYLGRRPANADLWQDYLDTQSAMSGVTEAPSGDLWIVLNTLVDPLPEVTNPARALAEGEVRRADVARTIIAQYDPTDIAAGPTQELEPCPSRGVGALPGGLIYCFDADPVGEALLTIMRLGS